MILSIRKTTILHDLFHTRAFETEILPSPWTIRDKVRRAGWKDGSRLWITSLNPHFTLQNFTPGYVAGFQKVKCGVCYVNFLEANPGFRFSVSRLNLKELATCSKGEFL